MRLLIALSLVLALQAPAFASFLAFAPGQTRPGLVISPKGDPVAGQDFPKDWTCLEWVVDNGDSYSQNYSLVKGAIVYDPPQPPPPPEPDAGAPDVGGFVTALRTDDNLDASIRMNMANLLALFQMDVATQGALQEDWNDVVSVYNTSWLTPKVQNIILNYAAAYNIPLVGK